MWNNGEMSREAKLNLLVLVFLILVLSPGAVILFKKKSAPGARQMDMPDPVAHRAVYIDWAQMNPKLPRFVPEQTGRWVRLVAKERWPSPGERRTLMGLHGVSEHRRMEVVAAGWDAENNLYLGLLLWDARLHGGEEEVTINGHRPVVLKREMVAVPQNIREELQKEGLVEPTKAVTWLELKFGFEFWGKSDVDFFRVDVENETLRLSFSVSDLRQEGK